MRRNDVSKLNYLTQRNYEATKNYYEQKENLILENYLQKNKENNKEVNLDKLKEDILKTIDKGILKIWEEAMKEIEEKLTIRLKAIEEDKNFSTLYFGKYDKYGVGVQAGSSYDTDFRVREEVVNEMTNILNNKTGVSLFTSEEINKFFIKKNEESDLSTFYSKMGSIFEFYMTKVLPSIVEGSDQILTEILKDLFSGIEQYGNIRLDISNRRISGGTVSRGSAKQTYADIGKNLTSDKETFIADLDANIDIIKEYGKKDQIKSIDFLFEKYITQEAHKGGYSFQLKNFNSFKKEFELTQMASLRKEINTRFQEEGQDPGLQDNKKSWNATYAINYAKMRVSENLISIIGPYNIGIIFKDKILFISQFLDQYYLNYHVYALRRFTSRGQNEILPDIHSNNIQAIKENYAGVQKVNIDKFKQMIDKKSGNTYYKINYSTSYNSK